jgi:aminodeoxyfutalosine deaminase
LIKLYQAKQLVSGAAPPIEGGALVVQDGFILATGTSAALKSGYPQAEQVDFGDSLIVPLLVNAHTHLELTDFPLWAAAAGRSDEPSSFVDWILNLIKIKIKLDKKLYHKSVANGLEQSLRTGTGAVGDILAHHSARDAYLGSPLEGVLYLETLGQKAEVIARVRTELFDALDDHEVGSVDLGMSPHSPYTISASYLRQIYDRCRTDQLRCTTHIAESPEEVDFLKNGRGEIASLFYPFVGWESHIPRTSGLSPVEYLQQQGGLFPQNLLVHGVQLTESEIEILAAEKMHLALCPRSNARLKVGKAPAAALLKVGVNLCLGTDSLASCDSLSIWDEMAFAHQWFAGELDAPTLFHMATLGGAQALGRDHCLGSLEKGKKAGFQVLQPQTKVASADVFDYFVSPDCAQDIVQVYHNGQAQLSGLN